MIPIFIVFSLTQQDVEPDSIDLVADTLNPQSLI